MMFKIQVIKKPKFSLESTLISISLVFETSVFKDLFLSSFFTPSGPPHVVKFKQYNLQ